MAKEPKKQRLPVLQTTDFPAENNIEIPAPVPGRPSQYRPGFCEEVIALGKQGMGPTQIAAALDVSKAVLYYWRQTHPDFDEAMLLAKTHEQNWWETVGQNALFADRFQAAVWSKSMAARFRDDYAERRETTLTGVDGGPVKTENTTVNKVDFASMTPEERDALRSIIMREKGSKRT